MAYGIWANEFPIEYFMVVQFMSFAISAYFAYRIVNSDIRLLGCGVSRNALAEVICYDRPTELDDFPYRAHDRRGAHSSFVRSDFRGPRTTSRL
jgi:hypothetical protein